MYNSPPSYWQNACRHLIDNDTILAKIIKPNLDITLTKSQNAYHTLFKAIIGQQISVKAADSIWQKMHTNLEIKSSSVAKLDVDTLKKFGLTTPKANYMLNLARHFEEYKCNDDEFWQDKSYDEIYENLIQIKGIGKWSIQMFAIFYINSQDILPTGDIGLQNALVKLYNLNKKPNELQMHKIAKAWQPYRTVATWFLWRNIDEQVVAY